MKTFQPFDSSYCVVQKEYSPECEKHYEGMFTQGSGYFHLRGSYEEGLKGAGQNEEYMRLPANVTIEKPRHPLSKWGTYLPGVTGVHPLLKEELVNLPYPAYFSAAADGETLDMGESDISDYERRLDLRDGVLYRSFVWNLKNGAVLHCEYIRYISRKRKNLLVQKMFYTVSRRGCRLKLISDIVTDVKTNGYNHFARVEKRAEGNTVDVEVETDNHDKVRISSRAECGRAVFSPAGPASGTEAELHDGDTLNVTKYSVLSCSRDPDGGADFPSLHAQLDEAVRHSDGLYRENAEEWDALWENSAILIEGDEKAQHALNFSIYHLLRAVNREDSRIAICAKGFAGEAYFGHFFWDTEIYLLPFFIYTDPEAAEKLVEFRINTLPGAKENARRYGYHGARYPWESSVSGLEQCPNWQYADNEVHVTADVTFGLWHYYHAAGDFEFLKKMAPVFTETAKYWLGRIEKKPDGEINLNGVMGPDEYICFCNNNAYTNYMVSFSLRNTLEILRILRERDYGFYKSLDIVPERLEEIKYAAEHLPVRKRKDGPIRQCDGFENFEEPRFDEFWKDRSKPYGTFVSQERNYRTKALKQADVLMLPYLFPGRFSPEEIRLNYDYYIPYTTHDSSLSAIIHSIICCRTGDADHALTFFNKALSVDMDEKKGGAGEGIHIANCGGIWQAIVFGFAGMSRCYESDTPHFDPHLPESWRSLSFKVIYKGEGYRVTIDHENIRVSLQDFSS